jgi:crotonobetainyl-CoA:carnitine CoA-transferase CaiB-like acyl-CoA transferase
MSSGRGGALAGIKVLDLSTYIAGPYGCTLLADLGAEVTKIEPPGGDTLRQYPSTLKEESRAFLGCNRSKLGISLDLKKPDGLKALFRLAESADVFVHNFRPSVPARLGIAYEQLKALNPRLIYCAVTGYGETGPLKDKAGYDQVLQCMTGMCVFQGDAENPEIVYGSPVDYYAASLLAYGVTAALLHRERTGRGQFVGVSLLRSALTMQSARFIHAEGEPLQVSRDMRSGGVTGIHPTREGRLYISANTPHFWSSLCELSGLPELAANPDYDSVRKRAARASELVPRLREALQAKSAREWEEVFAERVPCCAVRPIEEMFDHPQVLAEELVTALDHPKAGRYQGMQHPLKLSASPCPAPFAAPGFAQHTEQVLIDAGLSAGEICGLRESGAIPNETD